MSKMTDEQLEEMGLSPEEIAAIREDEGDEADGDGDGEGGDEGADEGQDDGNGDGDGQGAGSEGGEGGGEGGQQQQPPAATDTQEGQQEPPAAAAPAARGPDPRIGEIEAELTRLDEQFDNGDMTVAELRAARKELEKELDDLRWQERSVQLREEIALEEKVKSWGATIRTFLNVQEHRDFYKPDPKNPTLPYQALDLAVRQVQDQYRAEGKSDTDPSILEKAHSMVLEQFGIQKPQAAPDKQEQQVQQQPPKERKPAIPTLANVPAAATSETDTSQWGWLDRLRDNPNPDDPERFERELAKLPKDKREAYLAAG